MTPATSNDELRRFGLRPAARCRGLAARGRVALAAPTLSLRACVARPNQSDAPIQTSPATRGRSMITESQFRALAAQGYNRIPLVLESFADLDTPLSLYLKLANARYSFLLESVVGGERFGRYSFIGLPAQVRLRARGRHVDVEGDSGVRESYDGDPLTFVEAYRSRFHSAAPAGLPRFCGGLAGIFGYDVVRHIETRLANTAKPPTPGLADVPDLLLLLTEELAVVDNLRGKISLIVYAYPARPAASAQARRR